MTITTSNIRSRVMRPARQAELAHQFAVGQAVRLKHGFGRPPLPTDIYKITATLPPRGDSFQYRIRNDEERHERVATQDSLEAVETSAAAKGPTLLERTFGNGQGTEA